MNSVVSSDSNYSSDPLEEICTSQEELTFWRLKYGLTFYTHDSLISAIPLLLEAGLIRYAGARDYDEFMDKYKSHTFDHELDDFVYRGNTVSVGFSVDFTGHPHVYKQIEDMICPLT